MKDKHKKPKNNILIKDIDKNVMVGLNNQKSNTPYFSLRYLQEHSIKNCTDASFFRDFLFRLGKLSELGWKGIATSNKHSYGVEYIPIDRFIPQKHPPCITPDVDKLCVFRANGDNRAFAGIRIDNIFEVIYIEAQINDLYNHS